MWDEKLMDHWKSFSFPIQIQIQIQIQKVLLTGMLHQLYSSWSSVTSCVYTKQNVTIDNNDPRTTVNRAGLTEEKVQLMRTS